MLILYPWQGNHKLLLSHYQPRPSILRMIRSAHWTVLAIKDCVLGLGRDSCRYSGFFNALRRECPRPWPRLEIVSRSVVKLCSASLHLIGASLGRIGFCGCGGG